MFGRVEDGLVNERVEEESVVGCDGRSEGWGDNTRVG